VKLLEGDITPTEFFREDDFRLLLEALGLTTQPELWSSTSPLI